MGTGRSPDLLGELTLVVAVGHGFEPDRTDLAGLAGGAERFVARDADVLHGLGGHGEILARIKLAGVLGQEAPDRPGTGQPQIGVDIDLAHTVLDALDDFFHRYPVGLGNLAAKLVDVLQPLLRYRRGAVHHRVGAGDALVDRLDAVHGEDVAGRRPGELVGAVAGTNGDGERIDVGGLDELGSFVGVGQQLAVVEHALGADAVFFAGLASFQGTEAAQLTFHGDTAGMGHFHHAAGDGDVVVVVGGGLDVFLERAVHHHGTEAQLDGALADGRAGAVILVHDHRNVGELLDGRENQVAQKRCARVFACSGGRLHDHRGIGGVGSFHDGAHLFEVVDVERGNAVNVLGSVIKKLSQRYECHDFVLMFQPGSRVDIGRVSSAMASLYWQSAKFPK